VAHRLPQSSRHRGRRPCSAALLALLATALWLVACGNSEGDEVDPDQIGLDRSEDLVGLSPTEFAQVCDWSASKLGGYGASHDCGDVVGSQDECVTAIEEASLIVCSLTVGEWEDCLNALGGDLCRFYADEPEPRCAPLLACQVSFSNQG
jgi:hypothetical protein